LRNESRWDKFDGFDNATLPEQITHVGIDVEANFMRWSCPGPANGFMSRDAPSDM